VILVRSYPNPEKTDLKDHDHSWTIKDAALATAAAPLYFHLHAVTINGTEVLFEDAGANGANNPTMLAHEECQRLSDLQGKNSLFISLGTGSAPSQPRAGFYGFIQERFKPIKKQLTYGMNVHTVDQQMEKISQKSQM
jgi:patatin-like phospholipase/acyl hydrolase